MNLHKLIDLCEFGIDCFRIFKNDNLICELTPSKTDELTESIIDSKVTVLKFNIQYITVNNISKHVMFIYISEE